MSNLFIKRHYTQKKRLNNNKKEPMSNRDKIWLTSLIVGGVWAFWKTALENLRYFDDGTITYNILNFIFKGGFIFVFSMFIFIAPSIMILAPVYGLTFFRKEYDRANNLFEKILLGILIAISIIVFILFTILFIIFMFKIDVIRPNIINQILDGI